MLFILQYTLYWNTFVQQATLEMNIAAIRKEYKLRSLMETAVDPNPIIQFQQWWNEAISSNIEEPNAMTLATCGMDRKPSCRIVLLKGISNEGFVFFTNYNSRKGKELAENPHASLLFFWKEIERQVRVEGTVTRTSEEKSDEYFFSRPPSSRIGAWSSPQSEVISNREVLDNNVQQYEAQFGSEIPRPPHWGGYTVKPVAIEFWQGRPSQLHDRLLYTLDKGKWKIERLAP